MNLAAVMDQIGDAVSRINGLRVHRSPTEDLVPPAANVLYPEEIEYDLSMQRGTDRMTGGLRVVVARVTDRGARAQLAAYCDGAGPESIKAAIHEFDFTACSYVRVMRCRFDFYPLAGVDYLAADFALDIAGPGAGPT